MPESNYRRGRTTNEVLYDAGELDAFDLAALAKDSVGMVAALMRSGVPQDEAEDIVATVLKSPESYGF